ncbi:MAG: DUF302 domain-containing protein [Balneolaceae bacterium]
MSYHFSKTVNLPFDKAIEKTTAALKEEGFGVLTNIDIKETLKNKLDVEFRKYHILGACNPIQAHKALQAEEHIGLMLPCNVIVQEHENGTVEVSAVDPIASMKAVENESLGEVAQNVQTLLKKVIEKL